ncbi:hypothetical protein NRP21_25500, partial [Roseomonas pecuniae]|nr:hypothetical protein [Roseomonas pecuniae]
VLVGAGGLGLNAIHMLRALGHRRIVSVDVSAGKLDAARAAGASADSQHLPIQLGQADAALGSPRCRQQLKVVQRLHRHQHLKRSHTMLRIRPLGICPPDVRRTYA